MSVTRFVQNAEIEWTLPGPQVLDVLGNPVFDELTCEPVYESETTQTAALWLEININQTPLNAEVWDEDGSSEYLRINLIGRFVGSSPKERLWPQGLNPQDVVTLKYWMNQSHTFEVPAYVYPRGTTALRRPTRRLGDAIRVQARVQNDNYYDLASYFPKGASGEFL